HWSRFWDGGRWLEGEGAADLILGHVPAPTSLIPDVPAPPEPRPAPSARREGFADLTGDRLTRRILGYLARLPKGLGVGQRRDDFGFHFAAFLVRDLQLPDAVALEWMRRWDDLNAAAKGEDRLRELLASAHRYGKNPYGSGLDRRPGHSCIRFSVEVG